MRPSTRGLIGLLLGAAALPWAFGALAATTTVDVQNFSFAPSLATLAAGDTVTWHWVSGSHSVVEDSTNVIWCATRTTPAMDCPRTFSDTGTFTYHCGVHPGSMKAKLHVGSPPTVAITSPAAGSTVSGIFVASGTSSAPDGVDRVEVKVDTGAFALATGTTSWSISIDSTTLANGLRTIRARATSTIGTWEETSITVTVSNPSFWDFSFNSLTGATGLGGTTSVAVNVRNDGNTGAVGLLARYEYEYKETWRVIVTDTFNVPAFSSVARVKAWSGPTLVGNFPVRVTLDPGAAFTETDETNNQGFTSAAFWTTAVEGKDLRDP